MKLKYKILFIALVAIMIYQINYGSLFGFSFNREDVSLAESEEEYDPYKDLPKHNYNWQNLSSNNGRMEYLVPKGLQPTTGVDVSKYQGDIDWQMVKNSGISFAMIRTGYRGYETGKIKHDSKFHQNIEQASAAGLDLGVYFFSQAITQAEAIEEANFVLENIKGYELSYPIVFDLEEITEADHRTYYLTQEERTNIAIAFCETVENAGYTPMVYGNASWLTDYYDLNEVSEYDIWLAQYADQPTFPYEFTMWQYTDNGAVNGIDRTVDLNLCFKEY